MFQYIENQTKMKRQFIRILTSLQRSNSVTMIRITPRPSKKQPPSNAGAWRIVVNALDDSRIGSYQPNPISAKTS